MKIISGKYKGRKIDGYDLKGTRPTMERVKESLFATIQNYLENSIGIKDAEVINLDYKKALNYLKDKKMDLIFLDPPYKTDFIEQSIKLIDEYNILSDEGLIICENDSLDKIIYPDNYEVVKDRKYGDKWVVILRKIC